MRRSLARAKICHEVPALRLQGFILQRFPPLQGDFTVRTSRFSLLFVVVLCIGLGAAQARNVNVPEAKPEAVGFSSERLKRLDAGMKAIVDNKQLAGVSTLVTRHGQVVQQMVYGQADLASNAPLQKDTIVRIYSMTKPITGVAMMILYEEGKWKPSDPISRYIPEFKDLKVFKSLDARRQAGARTCPAIRRPMGELMSHTAGFTYGLFGSTPVDKMYMQANPLAAHFAQGIHRQGRAAAARLRAGPGLDVQRRRRHPGLPGREAVGPAVRGLPARAHLRAARHERHGVLRAGEQAVAARDDLPVDAARPGADAARSERQRAAGIPLGRRRTVLDRRRLPALRADAREPRRAERRAHPRAELGRADDAAITCRMRCRPRASSASAPIGSSRASASASTSRSTKTRRAWARSVGKGTFLWDGIAGTWFWVDPTNDIVFVGIIQRWAGPSPGPNIEDLSRALTMQALVDPSK